MRRFLLRFSLLAWLVVLSPIHAEVRFDLASDLLPPGALARLGSLRLRHGGRVNSLAFTPDGKGLLAGAEDGSLVLWDPVTGRERLRLIDAGAAITAAAVSPDGKVLVSASQDGQVLLWDAGSGQRLDCWQGVPGEVLQFLPGGRSLLLLGWDGIQCRDVATGHFTRCSPTTTPAWLRQPLLRMAERWPCWPGNTSNAMTSRPANGNFRSNTAFRCLMISSSALPSWLSPPMAGKSCMPTAGVPSPSGTASRDRRWRRRRGKRSVRFWCKRPTPEDWF